MAVLEYEGTSVEIDEDGYLQDPEHWNDTIANALAQQEGLSPLTYDQLDILMFMRQFYEKHSFFPIVTSVCKYVHQPDGCVSDEFMDPVTAWKIAGLPKPDDEFIGYLKR
jgi:TusE/DsrC/DsvC family sulfur relay protein